MFYELDLPIGKFLETEAALPRMIYDDPEEDTSPTDEGYTEE